MGRAAYHKKLTNETNPSRYIWSNILSFIDQNGEKTHSRRKPLGQLRSEIKYKEKQRDYK